MSNSLTTIEITDPVLGTDIGSVVLGVSPIQFDLHSGDLEEVVSYSFRMLLPETVDGEEFLAEYSTHLAEWAIASDESDQKDLERFFQMIYLYRSSVRHCRRRDALSDFDLAAAVGRHRSQCEMLDGQLDTEHPLLNWAVPGTSSTKELLENACYLPLPDIQISQEGYFEFRDLVLDELAAGEREFYEMADETYSELRTDSICKNPPPSLCDDPDLLETMTDIAEKFKNRSMRLAVRLERARAAPFQALVERVRFLQSHIADLVVNQEIPILDEEGAVTSQYMQLIDNHFDTTAADQLLMKFFTKLKVLRDKYRASDPETATLYRSYCHAVAGARRSVDACEKWDTLLRLSDQLSDRSGCMAMVQREADEVFHRFASAALHRIYRKIRGKLSRAERRLFLLAWRCHPTLNNRVPMFDPVLRSFAFETDSHTLILLLTVLVVRPHSFSDFPSISAELERRFRAYLHVFPHCHESSQEEARERQRRRVQPTISLDLPRNDSTSTLAADLPARSEQTSIKAERCEQLRQNIPKWTQRYCSEAQRRYLCHRLEGLNDSEIARVEGRSQQAVNKSLRNAYTAVRTGVNRDDRQVAEQLEDAAQS